MAHRFNTFANGAELAEALATRVASALAEAVAARGEASIAVSGGSTPKAFFKALSAKDIDWKKVVITLVDERFVPPESDRSNHALVSAALLQDNAAAAKFLPLYKKLCPKAVMQLEIITGRPPDVLPYFEPEFWKAFPNMPASEFARFVALAKKGRPFMGNMLVASGKLPPAITEALKEQQRIDLERSFEYAKKTLGVGIRWKAS